MLIHLLSEVLVYPRNIRFSKKMIKILEDKIIKHTERIFYTIGLLVALVLLIL
ncbi:MAG: hypothetical protein KDC88_12510 [Ignavibacteriae bacterium]|nr:hypothetical protein [Ignavibacteriota bacterium]MCB9209762.1 hypothetical protein [Ignavibacteriales bacterium]MCB9218918.1 hypothetical protein [Ignavibacteriales bacterium]